MKHYLAEKAWRNSCLAHKSLAKSFITYNITPVLPVYAVTCCIQVVHCAADSLL